EDPPVAVDHEQAVEESPGCGFSFRMTDEANYAKVGGELCEVAQPAVGLCSDPFGPDQLGEAIAGYDQLAGHDPVGAEGGGRMGAGLDQGPVLIERAQLGCEMQKCDLKRPSHCVSTHRSRALGRRGEWRRLRG